MTHTSYTMLTDEQELQLDEMAYKVAKSSNDDQLFNYARLILYTVATNAKAPGGAEWLKSRDAKIWLNSLGYDQDKIKRIIFLNKIENKLDNFPQRLQKVIENREKIRSKILTGVSNIKRLARQYNVSAHTIKKYGLDYHE